MRGRETKRLDLFCFPDFFCLASSPFSRPRHCNIISTVDRSIAILFGEEEKWGKGAEEEERENARSQKDTQKNEEKKKIVPPLEQRNKNKQKTESSKELSVSSRMKEQYRRGEESTESY